MNKIDSSISKLRLDFEAEPKEQQHFREAVIRMFMALYNDGLLKCLYGDSSIGFPYTVRKFNMQQLRSFCI